MPREHRGLATLIAMTVGVIAFLLISVASGHVFIAGLTAFGVFAWIRDVRNAGGERPKWLSLFLGSLAFLGLGIGAVVFRQWADRILGSQAIPLLEGVFIVLALFFVGFGLWLYVEVPSDRVIARWQEFPWDIGVMCAFLPMGLAILLMFLAFGVPVGDTWTTVLFWLAMVPSLFALLLLFWQPNWIKPRWMRDLD